MGIFFVSAPKDAENHTLIQIRITEFGISSELDAFFLNDTQSEADACVKYGMDLLTAMPIPIT